MSLKVSFEALGSLLATQLECPRVSCCWLDGRPSSWSFLSQVLLCLLSP